MLKKFWFFYIDSVGQGHQVPYQLHEYNNLMELIRDQSLEDWGDCRGRAWCGTCHIEISNSNLRSPPDSEEINRLDLLSNSITNSRLACQIFLDQQIHQMEFKYIGDD